MIARGNEELINFVDLSGFNRRTTIRVLSKIVIVGKRKLYRSPEGTVEFHSRASDAVLNSTSESVPAVLVKEFRGGFNHFDAIAIAQGTFKWKSDSSINVKRDSLGRLQDCINSIGRLRILSFSRTQGFPRETENFLRVTSSASSLRTHRSITGTEQF